MTIVYLISGANRGIGLGLVAQLATRPDVVVFAGARNLGAATELKKLVDSHPNVVHAVKLTSGDLADNAAAVETIKKVAGRLDVVIANAGIQNAFKGAFESTTAELRSHWDVNVGGPHVLLQQTLSLLRASPRDASNPPKFIVISSAAGSTELSSNYKDMAPYRSSKNAVNFLAREIHFEHEEDGLVSFPICPGPVDTDMAVAAKANVEAIADMAVNTVETSVTGILKVVDSATRETHGGKFVNYEGEPRPW